jgi:hypothetical protein
MPRSNDGLADIGAVDIDADDLSGPDVVRTVDPGGQHRFDLVSVVKGGMPTVIHMVLLLGPDARRRAFVSPR